MTQKEKEGLVKQLLQPQAFQAGFFDKVIKNIYITPDVFFMSLNFTASFTLLHWCHSTATDWHKGYCFSSKLNSLSRLIRSKGEQRGDWGECKNWNWMICSFGPQQIMAFTSHHQVICYWVVKGPTICW